MDQQPYRTGPEMRGPQESRPQRRMIVVAVVALFLVGAYVAYSTAVPPVEPDQVPVVPVKVPAPAEPAVPPPPTPPPPPVAKQPAEAPSKAIRSGPAPAPRPRPRPATPRPAPKSETTASAPAPAPPPTVAGQLSRVTVRRVMSGAASRLDRCYRDTLKRVPGLRGKATIRFTVQPGGKVSGVEVTDSTVDDAALTSCLTGVVRRLAFPDPGAGPVTVNYPLRFQP